MKTFNHFSKEYGLLMKGLFLLLVFIIGCTKDEIEPVGYNDNLNETNCNSVVNNKGTIHLKGITGFGFYSAKEHKVLADPYKNTCECTAELTFSGKQNFVLHTQEFTFGIMYREISFNGKMTHGGELKFSWPYSFTEFNFVTNQYEIVNVGPLPEIKLHTGCVLYGPGINKNTLDYKGYFRRNKFFADTHFVGIQKVPGQIPFLSTIVDGPIMINFLIDLEVSD
jgi:hypothetical protein